MAETSARLLRLLPLLTARRSWRGEELAGRLGVTARTVRRDIGRLRGLGYPVHAVPGPAGGYALGTGAELPPLLLDDDAAVAVVLGLHAAAAGTVAGAQEAAVRAIAAIGQVMPARLRRRVAALQAATVALTQEGPAVDSSVLALLALACRDGERVRFAYTDHAGTASRRHAEPYRLVCTGRRWYLVAHDIDRRAWRSFRLDRLTEPLLTGRRSRPGNPPDAARFVADAVSSGPYRWRARVVLDAPAAVVAARVPPTAAMVEALDDQRCLLTAGADSLDLIALHIALLGVPFTPLAPPELRERCGLLAQRLRDAARRAGRSPPDPRPPAETG